MKVAVIGAGVIGACVGWNLSRLGAKVVFIDAGRPGEGVTQNGSRESGAAEPQGRCGR